MSEPKFQVCQIQIQPVDDGFVFQAVNIDGARKSAKQIASDVSQLREKLHKLVDTIYEPSPAPPTASTPEEPSGGSAGTKSTAGTQA